MTEIDTGDSVHHTPTGEDWVVAYVRGDRLAWCGWPEGEAALSDCTMVTKATPEWRDKLLREMAENTDGARGRYARAVLARLRCIECLEPGKTPCRPGHCAAQSRKATKEQA